MIEPPQLCDLPRHPDRERFPIMAAQIHTTGNAAEPDQLRALARRNRCAGCGCEVGEMWTVLLDEGGPAASCSRFSGMITSSAPALFHLSCLIYCLIGCPALRSSRRIYRENPVVRGLPRGKAELVQFGHIGLPAFPHGRDKGISDVFAMWHLGERIPFDNSKELLDHLEASTRSENVDVSTRLYWRESDQFELLGLIMADRREQARIRRFSPNQGTVRIDGKPVWMWR